MRQDNTYYLFDFYKTKDAESPPEHYLVIFWVNETISFKRLSDSIKVYLTNNFAPTKIIFLTPLYNKSRLSDLQLYIQENHISDSLFFFDNKKNIEYLYFNELGQIFKKSITDKIFKNPTLLNELVQVGLLKIFKERGGILNSSSTSHYEYPSGKHAKKFIRTGNILSIGVEVNFIAFCLLKFFRTEISEIVCDTSTIISIAQALINLRRCINHNLTHPNINSFGSYEGLDNFQFEDSSTTLVLISASTSGSLAKKVLNKGKPFLNSEDIITIYYLSSTSKFKGLEPWNNIGKILCSLDFHKDNNKDGYNPIEFFRNGEECDFCNIDNSLPLKIIGDQFLPEKINIKVLTITTNHSPKWLEEFMSEFSMNKVLICHRKKRDTGDQLEKRELFIDLELIHKKASKFISKSSIVPTEEDSFFNYTKSFLKIIEQNIPASLSKIIYLDDDASQLMAEQIKAYYYRFAIKNDDEILLKYEDQLDVYEKIKDIPNGTILVVGSSVSTSRKLLNISRLLRNNDKISIIYFVGIMRTYNHKDYEDIKMNICYGNMFGSNTNALYHVHNIHIPDDQHLSRGTSWDEEIELLNNLTKIKTKAFIAVKKDILNRISVLNENKDGLIPDLFWKTPDDNNMALRRGFAFFNFPYEKDKISQADVYFTISSIIHHLRTEKIKGEIQLEQQEHQVCLLDPHNFDRFNDGIIQSAILRAAKSEELNYSVDNKISSQMTDIIIAIIEHRRESAYEFMLAMSTKKIKLTIQDTRKIYKTINNTAENDLNTLSKNLYKLFGSYLISNIIS